MKTVEEKAEEYADREIPIVYTDETQTISLTELRQAAKIDYLAGYSEAMRCQSSPKIKQLEWMEYENFHGRKSYLSKTPFSSYDVADGGDHFTMFSPNNRLRFASADEAKAAAQADFEKRVMECLGIADNSNK